MGDTVITIGSAKAVYWAACYRFAPGGAILVRVLGPRALAGLGRDLESLLGPREQDDTLDGLYWTLEPVLLPDVEEHLRARKPLHAFCEWAGHIPHPSRELILV